MTQTIQQTRSQLADIKAKLKVETNPEKLYRLAVYGEELNRLLLELLGEPPKTRCCRKCSTEKAMEDFPYVKAYYRLKSGELKLHFARRNTCNECYNKQVARSKKKSHKKEFNWLF